MSEHFHKPYEPFGGDIIFKFDISNYATKFALKETTRADLSYLVVKSDLAEVDKINTEKLNTVFVDLSNLSNAVNHEVVEKTVYDKLVANVDAAETSGFVSKTKYDTNKSELEKKINDADKETPDTRHV